MKANPDEINAIPCMVLTFTNEEIAFVKSVLETEGYEDDLKKWILDNMMIEEDSREGSADRVIHNLSEFLRNNPETIRTAGQFMGNLFSRAIKKGPQK